MQSWIGKISSFFLSLLKSVGQDAQAPAHIDASTGNEDASTYTENEPETPINNCEDGSSNVTEDNMPQYEKLMVHLDNGHGKATPGKRSPSTVTGKGYGQYTKDQLSIYEYDYNRKVVKVVDEKLRKLGFKTYIVTPEVEGDIGLTMRSMRSNNMAAKYPNLKHIFISAHLNAAGDGKTWYTGGNASYWCCYTSKGQTQGDKLADCFYDAAEEILPKYKKKIKTDLSDKDRDVEENFTVLTRTNSPAVLVESLFMTNVDDVLFLKSEEGLKAVTDIYVKAVIKYFDKYVK